MDYGGGSEKGVRDRSRLASAAAGEAAHLAHEAGHMAQEVPRGPSGAETRRLSTSGHHQCKTKDTLDVTLQVCRFE